MRERPSPEELFDEHQLLRSDPQRYLQIQTERIREDPQDAYSLFSRHLGWKELGEPRNALEDLNRSIELVPDQMAYLSRGLVHRDLGEHKKAIDDFESGEAMDPQQWHDDAFGLYYQADSHAHLGNLGPALSYSARLPDHFWTPGIFGAPAGNKEEIANELRRIAKKARQRRT